MHSLIIKTLRPLSKTIIICNLFHYLFKSLLLRMKCVFKQCLVSNETNISNCQPLEDGRGNETQLRHGHLTEYLGKITCPATGYIILTIILLSYII